MTTTTRMTWMIIKSKTFEKYTHKKKYGQTHTHTHTHTQKENLIETSSIDRSFFFVCRGDCDSPR